MEIELAVGTTERLAARAVRASLSAVFANSSAISAEEARAAKLPNIIEIVVSIVDFRSA